MNHKDSEGIFSHRQNDKKNRESQTTRKHCDLHKSPPSKFFQNIYCNNFEDNF